MFGLNIDNVHRGVKKSFRFKFSRNVNKDRRTKVTDYAIAEHNAKIDAETAKTALLAAVIAKTEAIKAIVMVDKFLASTSTFKNNNNYRVTKIRLKANEALTSNKATKAAVFAMQAAINAEETAVVFTIAALGLEANIAMSVDSVVDVESNT